MDKGIQRKRERMKERKENVVERLCMYVCVCVYVFVCVCVCMCVNVRSKARRVEETAAEKKREKERESVGDNYHSERRRRKDAQSTCAERTSHVTRKRVWSRDLLCVCV